MANTDVGVAAGGLGKTIAAAIVQFNKAAVTPATISMAAAVKGSNTVQFPVYSKLAVTAVTNEATGDEDTEVAATSITTAATSVEVLRNHINARVTDLAAYGNSDALMVNAGQVLGNAVAAEFDANICARFDAFATSKGTSTEGLTWVDIMDAVASLETNDAPRPYSAVLHPQQMYGSFGLSNELGQVAAVNNSNGAFGAGSSTAEQFLQAGFVTTLAGINFYTSPQVIDGSDSTEKKGAIYAKTALGCGYIDFGGGSFIEMRTERNELGASTNLVANGYWASAELVDLHGVEIFTEIS
tara:strand:+ start:4885 stop:5781 length:897 start_codon:yes stop_codon:yes gene_type:complete